MSQLNPPPLPPLLIHRLGGMEGHCHSWGVEGALPPTPQALIGCGLSETLLACGVCVATVAVRLAHCARPEGPVRGAARVSAWRRCGGVRGAPAVALGCRICRGPTVGPSGRICRSDVGFTS